MKKQNFLQGALILMAASLIVKVFGAIFKIPLTNIIGVSAMAYFNTAYSFYVIFYMISTAGIPVALSKMISSADAKGNKKEVDKIFKVAYILFFILGLAGSLFMITFAKKYSGYVKLSGLEYAITAITPTLFFMCITSAYRGYFQGMKNMAPTAISQVIGAIGKLFLGLIVAIIAVNLGAPDHMVAAYTILGITVGSIGSTLFLSIYKKISDKKSVDFELSTQQVTPSGKLLKELIEIAIPITLSATILSLTNTIDTTFMVRRLAYAGTAVKEATKIMGAYTSMSVPLFNLTPNLIYPFAISVIPSITAMHVNRRTEDARNTISSTFRIASLISIPCSLGLSIFARPIVSLLYDSKDTILLPFQNEEVSAINVAAEMLSILSIAIFFVAMVSVTNGVLQAYGKEKLTIISTTLGILFKVVLNYVLIGTKSINYYGAPLSTLVCYFVITALNFYFLVKYCGYYPKVIQTVLKPLASALIGVGASAFIYKLIFEKLGASLSTVISIFIAAILYFVIIFAIKGVDKEDIRMLPKGDKLVNLLTKLNFLR